MGEESPLFPGNFNILVDNSQDRVYNKGVPSGIKKPHTKSCEEKSRRYRYADREPRELKRGAESPLNMVLELHRR